MATVCGGTLAMLDAGIPIKEPVAGIAMGLIKEGDGVIILSDILGLEDHLGDMDFKVCGTKNGVTALQMDIKIGGITMALMQQALEQARTGRIHILERMASALTTHRANLSPFAPVFIRSRSSRIRSVTSSARAGKPFARSRPIAASRSISKTPASSPSRPPTRPRCRRRRI